MVGFAILLAFHLLGYAVKAAVSIPLPPNVIGLILFTAALFLKIVKLEWVEQSAQFLLRHMMLFFAPLIVGTIAFFPLLGREWLAAVVSLIGGTVVVLLVTGWVTTLAAGLGSPGQKGKKGRTPESKAGASIDVS